jgi:sulfofructose kinase
MGFDVVGFGMNCVDCFLRLPDLTFLERRGDSPVEETSILEWTIQGGGKVATAMAAVGRLGADVAVITKVGDDEWGRFVIADFQKYGVDTRNVVVDEGINTSVVFILVGKQGSNRWVPVDVMRDWDLPNDIQRAVQWTEAHRRPSAPPTSLPQIHYTPDEVSAVTDGKILNLDGLQSPETALEVARLARAKGIPTVYDMYSHPNLRALLPHITYCIPSRRAAMAFTHETDPRAMCRAILAHGPEVAGVTLGEDGVVFATRHETVVRKAFPVHAVDTTGAGDVFHGAFSFGVVQGWDLARVVEFASAVAALKCRRLGGRAGIPARAEVDAYLRDHVDAIR